jgi:uncharacterized protein
MTTSESAIVSEPIGFGVEMDEQKPASTGDIEQLTPISTSQRIDSMDILRGFALIGILLMNIEWFNRPIVSLLQFDHLQTGADWTASWLVKVFVEGKFYKLFSLLFGMGFAVMLLRAQELQRPFTVWFVRRMLVLFVFGMLHMIFFWGGDILHDYAFAGLLLLGWILLLKKPKFQRFQQPKSFLRIGVGILVVPFILATLAGTFFGASRDHATLNEKWQQHQQIDARVEQLLQQTKTTSDSEQLAPSDEQAAITEPEVDEDSLSPEQLIEYKAQQQFTEKAEQLAKIQAETEAVTQTSYWQTTKYRAQHALKALAITPMFALMMGLPIFMIGYWLIASGIMRQPERHVGLFKNLAGYGLSLGIFTSVGGVLIAQHPAVKHALEIQAASNMIFFLGQCLLTAGYLGGMMLLILNQRSKRYLAWLAPLGRMALTNYLAHSVILTSVFYGYGAGMFGHISRAPQMLMVLAIILIQAWFSTWWLSKFRFGPFEWLWRCFSYWQLQPMRKLVVSSRYVSRGWTQC